MKTIVQLPYTNMDAIIKSEVFCQFDNNGKPIWHDEKSGLAKTGNDISEVIIYLTNTESGKTTVTTIAYSDLKLIMDKCNEVFISRNGTRLSRVLTPSSLQ